MTDLSRFLRGLRYIAMATFVVVSVMFSANSAYEYNECNPMESVSVHVKYNMISMAQWEQYVNEARQSGSSTIPNATNYEYILSQCSETPSSYDLTNTYSGLKCYIAMPSVADAYCYDTSDSNMCDENGETIYSPENYTYAFFMGNVNNGEDKIVIDAAGNVVSDVNTALASYFNTYQSDFSAWLFNSVYNSFYNNGCGAALSTINLFCFEDTYLTHAPIDIDGTQYSLPIDTYGYPLFSNVYYPNMDGYTVTYQLYYGEVTPPVVYYDFRRDTNTNYGYDQITNLTNTTDGYTVAPYIGDNMSSSDIWALYANINTPYGGSIDDFISDLATNNNPYYAQNYLDLTNTDYTDSLTQTLNEYGYNFYTGDPQTSIQLLNYYNGAFTYTDSLETNSDPQSGSDTTECIGDVDGFNIVPADGIPAGSGGGNGGGSGQGGNSCSTGYDTMPAINIKSTIGNSAGSSSAYFIYNNQAYNRDGTYHTQKYFDITNDVSNGAQFAVDYGSAGMITGRGICSTHAIGSYTGEQFASVTHNPGSGLTCFCHIDTYKPVGFAKQNVSSQYFYVTQFSQPGNCGYACAGSCLGTMSDTSTKNLTIRGEVLQNISPIAESCQPISYDITYNLDNGTNNNSNPEYYSITDSAITLQNPTRSNYIFAGWCTDSAKTNCASTQTIPSGSTGNKEYWAKWEPAKFWVTTNTIPANNAFAFQISARGTFYVDWGDGNVQIIDRTLPDTTAANLTLQTVSHTYTTAGARTIRFGGLATEYSSQSDTISTFKFTTGRGNITTANGRLGRIFPTLNNGAASNTQQPKFIDTFQGASKLTTIYEDLFYGDTGTTDGVRGYGLRMFQGTFGDCTTLTSIPTNLFAAATYGAYYMFNQTFRNTGITKVPSGLFATLTHGDGYMFSNTFGNCANLTEVESNVWPNLSGGNEREFSATFRNCTKLTTLPSGLFSAVTIGHTSSFSQTFYGCTSLTSLPENLFGSFGILNITFGETFKNSGLTSIPPDLFSRMSGTVFDGTFSNTFDGTKITSIPAGLFSKFSDHPTSSTKNVFYQTFANCPYLTSVPHGLFSKFKKIGQGTFIGTFQNDTALVDIPSDLFTQVNTVATQGYTNVFQDTFKGCTNLNTIKYYDNNNDVYYTATPSTGDNFLPHKFFGSVNIYGSNSSTIMPDVLTGTGLATTCPTGTTQTADSVFNSQLTPKAMCSFNIEYENMTDATNFANAPQTYINNTSAITLGTPTKTGYNFGGWYLTSNFSDTPVTEISAYSYGEKTLYARWQNIIYELDGGTNNANNPDTYTVGTETTISGKPTKTNYMFVGWCTDSAKTNCAMTQTISAQATGTQTFYAKWEAVKFSITTSSFAADEVFSFHISAQGTFYVDWDDGTVQKIDRTETNGFTSENLTKQTVSHTYTTAGARTIKFGGRATLYSSLTDSTNTNDGRMTTFRIINGKEKITVLSGRLGAIFPTLNGGTVDNAYQPKFYATFANATSLNTVPGDLFYDANDLQNSVYGAGQYMFASTFSTCSSLTTIQPGLFSGVSGSSAMYMFNNTFAGSGITAVPENLFSGAITPAEGTFNGTFKNCSDLTTVPGNVFSGVSGSGGKNLFRETFKNDTSLGTIYSTWFSGLTGGGEAMFQETFYGCTSLEEVPSGMFSSINTAANYMFKQTFMGCNNLTTLSANLFYNLKNTSYKQSIFEGTFKNCTALNDLPSNLFGLSYVYASTFKETFYGCSGLTHLPNDLFQSITLYNALAGSGFTRTFMNSGLTEIPANLFSKILTNSNTPANGNMFSSTFNGTKIRTIPHGLFKTISTITSAGTFEYTFANCTLLESIPSDLFSNITLYLNSTSYGPFVQTFVGDTLLTSVLHYDNNDNIYDTTSFLPATFFGTALDSLGAGKIDNMFSNTGLATSCPSGTTRYNPTYASTGMNNKVMCSYNINYENMTGATNNASNPATYIDNSSAITLATPTKTGYDFGGWYTDSGLTTGNEATNIPAYSYGAKTVYAKWDVAKFSLDTYSINTFSFKISAKGTFTVDCGNNGTLSGNGVGQDGYTITKPDTTDTTYTCTWGTAATQTIQFDGLATEYNSTTTNDIPVAAISFYTSQANAEKIKSIHGSLGLIFPTLTDASLTNVLQKQPRFYRTFMNAKISSAPSTLFYNVSGGADRMFQETFRAASLNSLPDSFFNGITGGGQYMFYSTFAGCSFATLPNDLFSTVNTSAANMFYNTFAGSRLTGLNANLFGGLTAPATSMFNSTFTGCTSLTSLPGKLFGSIVGSENMMFTGTFSGCTGLTTIPYDLFYQNNNAVRYVTYRTFAETFKGCTGLTYIPSGLFNQTNATTNWSASGNLFLRTFEGCTSLKRVPYDLFSFPYYTSADRQMFQETFKGCTALDTVVHPGPDNTTYETNFLTKKFFGSSANLSTYYSNMFTNVFQNTGLAASCSTGTSAQTGINANYDFNGKAFCEYNIVQENIGDGTPATPTTYIDNATAISLGNPSRSGYDFDGWYKDANFIIPATAPQISAYSHGEQKFWAKWTPIVYQCPAGQYLPKGNDWATNNYDGCTQCPINSYCPAGNHTFNETTDQGLNACTPTHPYSPAGMWQSSQCGRRLHIGNDILYLHQSPATPTTHRLFVNYDNTNYSANAVPRDINAQTFPKMSTGAEKGFHVMIGGVEYLVCDDSICPNTPAQQAEE